jgi:hypothetical protein
MLDSRFFTVIPVVIIVVVTAVVPARELVIGPVSVGVALVVVPSLPFRIVARLGFEASGAVALALMAVSAVALLAAIVAVFRCCLNRPVSTDIIDFFF